MPITNQLSSNPNVSIKNVTTGNGGSSSSSSQGQRRSPPNPTNGVGLTGVGIPSRGEKVPLVVKGLICWCKGRITPERAR